MYDYQTLSVAKADRIATLTLNRPDQMNLSLHHLVARRRAPLSIATRAP